jgi:hypothetical protein
MEGWEIFGKFWESAEQNEELRNQFIALNGKAMGGELTPQEFRTELIALGASQGLTFTADDIEDYFDEELEDALDDSIEDDELSDAALDMVAGGSKVSSSCPTTDPIQCVTVSVDYCPSVHTNCEQ